MTYFELVSTNCDGHIRALSKAILTASRVNKYGLLEFTPDKMRVCTRSELFLVKFCFMKDFFSSYECKKERHRCYINLKALLMPFKSLVLVNDRDLRSKIKITCLVEDEVNSQIVFKIGSDQPPDQPSATLTYKLTINEQNEEMKELLNSINRKIHYSTVDIAPKQCKNERFLLSAFNSFAPDIDQVTIKTSLSEVKFIGSTSVTTSNTISEFTHKRHDFSTFNVKEELTITIPIRCLKMFLTFVETSRVQTYPTYIFEGMEKPAHFIYQAGLYKGHFVSATPYEFVEMDTQILPITLGPDESFIVDENVVQLEDQFDNYQNVDCIVEEDEEDGYNDNESESSDFLDGNLEGLNATGVSHNVSFHNNSIYGTESIRSEMSELTFVDPKKAKEILDLDKDPDEIENVKIEYSSDSDSSDD